MITVSTDPALIDVDTIHRWLSQDAYWARGRPREVVARSVESSLNFGAHDGGALIGYARVVTDHATYAWICDVYVDPSHRGAGVGRALVGAVHETLTGLEVGRAMLATEDAQSLYTEFGFEPLAGSDKFMARGYAPDRP